MTCNTFRRQLLVAALPVAVACLAAPPAANAAAGDATSVDHSMHVMTPAADMPGDSLFQLPLHFTNADGAHVMLSQYRGRPVVITMFYGTCKAACPLLTRAMTETAAALPVEVRGKVQFLMVTLDPQRDTVAALHEFTQEYRLTAPQFEVARTDANGVRLLAAALGIRYRQLPDGNFSHSSILTVLDGQGVPQARTEVLAAADPQFVDAVRRLAR